MNVTGAVQRANARTVVSVLTLMGLSIVTAQQDLSASVVACDQLLSPTCRQDML